MTSHWRFHYLIKCFCRSNNWCSIQLFIEGGMLRNLFVQTFVQFIQLLSQNIYSLFNFNYSIIHFPQCLDSLFPKTFSINILIKIVSSAKWQVIKKDQISRRRSSVLGALFILNFVLTENKVSRSSPDKLDSSLFRRKSWWEYCESIYPDASAGLPIKLWLLNKTPKLSALLPLLHTRQLTRCFICFVCLLIKIN